MKGVFGKIAKQNRYLSGEIGEVWFCLRSSVPDSLKPSEPTMAANILLRSQGTMVDRVER